MGLAVEPGWRVQEGGEQLLQVSGAPWCDAGATRSFSSLHTGSQSPAPHLSGFYHITPFLSFPATLVVWCVDHGHQISTGGAASAPARQVGDRPAGRTPPAAPWQLSRAGIFPSELSSPGDSAGQGFTPTGLQHAPAPVPGACRKFNAPDTEGHGLHGPALMPSRDGE